MKDVCINEKTNRDPALPCAHQGLHEGGRGQIKKRHFDRTLALIDGAKDLPLNASAGGEIRFGFGEKAWG